MINLDVKRRKITSAVILGSTGSVGMQTVDVVRELGLTVEMLTAGRNIDLLAEQIHELSPKRVSVADEKTAVELGRSIGGKTEILFHHDEVCSAVRETGADIIFHSVGGLTGMETALAAAESGKRVAMANKEAIISAGDMIFDSLRRSGGELIPVDSEHSAIFRCLRGQCDNRFVKKIMLTASGGPFFGMTAEELQNVTLDDALAHPTWKMGKKITIDSATMMNKGFEIIEAVRLYGIPEDRIEVLIHRQSIIHSMVEYNDNTVIASMGLPDMRDCIRYAVTAPDTASVDSAGPDFARLAALTFAEPDTAAFPLLNVAREAVRVGGTLPVSLIAADETAVEAFMNREIGFTDISSFVLETLGKVDVSYEITAETICEAERQARFICGNLIKGSDLN